MERWVKKLYYDPSRLSFLDKQILKIVMNTSIDHCTKILKYKKRISQYIDDFEEAYKIAKKKDSVRSSVLRKREPASKNLPGAKRMLNPKRSSVIPFKHRAIKGRPTIFDQCSDPITEHASDHVISGSNQNA